MTATIQRFAFALVLAFFGMAWPPLTSIVAAQGGSYGFDLSGTWELQDRGELFQSERAIIRIIHTGSTVRAVFISGISCRNREVRSYLFVAKQSGGSLSSDDMWVCSGSPSRVEECGISAKYKTNFKNATADLNLIKGKRARQFVGEDCGTGLDSEADSEFTLTRVTCAQLEGRVAERETELRGVLNSIRAARPIFLGTYEAAQQHFGQAYNGVLTNTLIFPIHLVAASWDDHMGLTEEFFATLPEMLASQEWTGARDLARAMGDGTDPLPAATRMHQEMYRVEATNEDGQRVLVELRNARAQLEACRRGRP